MVDSVWPHITDLVPLNRIGEGRSGISQEETVAERAGPNLFRYPSIAVIPPNARGGGFFDGRGVTFWAVFG